MSFCQLSTDLQLELLGFVSPPDWPEYLVQFLEVAEQEFEPPHSPARLDVWGSCKVHDAEIRGPVNWVNAQWSIHPTVVVERATYGEGFMYKLGVYSEQRVDYEDDIDGQRDDWGLGSTVEKTWYDREEFLREASNLLDFCPRQIKRLPRLACHVGLVRFDKYIDIVNLRGRPFWYLHHFSDNAGVNSLLRNIQNGSQ